MKYLINFSGSLWIIFAILWLLVAVSSILDSPAVYSSDLVFVTYWLYGIWGIVMGIFIFSSVNNHLKRTPSFSRNSRGVK
jgi:hypothetical protein